MMSLLSKFVDSKLGEKLAVVGAFPVMCVLTLIALREVKKESKDKE